jgi:hypothetical protein
MKARSPFAPFLVAVMGAISLRAHAEESSPSFDGLVFRSIGPAVTSGRIGDITVHPREPKICYAAAASGGV